MVVRLPAEHDQRTDRVFHALADATRRDIVARALAGGHSVTALARNYPMSFAAVQKHVAVLHDAGIIDKHRRGREQVVTVRIDALTDATEILEGWHELWRGRVARMHGLLDEQPDTS